jgi:endonuclease YncB( thermonuclease family)
MRASIPGLLSGTASVIDGDTIEIHGQRIRLDGVDTPERGKRCGNVNVYQKAALSLSDFIGAATVSCTPEGKSDERITARCDAHNKDLGLAMAEAGWARDWLRYSGGDYAAAEAEARRAKKGLWGLTCPEDLWGNRVYD